MGSKKESNERKKNEYFFQYEHAYICTYWKFFNYNILKRIRFDRKRGGASGKSYNNAIMMFDTETSKSAKNKHDGDGKVIPVYNYVVAFAVSIRCYGVNICTLYGNKPSELVDCITLIRQYLIGDDIYLYAHNLSYDWTFVKRFMIDKWEKPINQLNTKPHYPINIRFENGIVLRDSLILAQRSLDKWAKDMGVEHQKAVGKWDYDKIRQQDHIFIDDEIEYIEHDTLAGVECIDAFMKSLGKNISSIPMTATGVPREQLYNEGVKVRAKEKFKRQALTYDQYIKMEHVYHGGYTHANRHYIDDVIDSDFITDIYPGAEPVVKCADFSSSYPYTLLSEKFPAEKFTQCDDCSIYDILECSEEYAYIFKLILVNVRLKSDDIEMPALQFSKCLRSINDVCDNGRILCADYVEIYLNEIDASIIANQYIWDKHICVDVESAYKDYLPRYITDFVYQAYKNKTKLKGGDPVSYAISKSVINSIYGMMVQKCLRVDYAEDYDTGEYVEESRRSENDYQEYLDNRKKILNYQIGVYVTSYAMKNLFQLFKCYDIPIYADTDSCYGIGLHDEMLEAYNKECIRKLKDNGYDAVLHKGREYWLGIAEHDPEEDIYTEFKVMGAKRYCGRRRSDGKLKITVAGVPKKGVQCLHDDIHNFTTGFIFDGNTTGKLTHYYLNETGIKIDSNGNEYADSVDLCPCDYLLSRVPVHDWESLFTEEITIQVYEEE